MSLLSSFVSKNLLPALEDEFISLEPLAQTLLLSEAQSLAKQLGEWIDSKLSHDVPSI
ncbi:hypothetical protein UFOVP100_36 [uncultured Caudovirales phage]|uniref:Uncharacterized protein n=1 Tax=uncultured Caudovirales phage TaxID=2100421 RepID=A0A6J5L1I2_9CAUD|nr:hypothetical protein UFOVP100_36 [uncultured Caudovirales phage]